MLQDKMVRKSDQINANKLSSNQQRDSKLFESCQRLLNYFNNTMQKEGELLIKERGDGIQIINDIL